MTVYDSEFPEKRGSIMDLDLRASAGVTYLHYAGEPLFPFGTGLSYTSFDFAFADPAQADQSAACEAVAGVAYDVVATNTGAVESDVVLLGFLARDDADAPRNGELFGYARLARLAPGESRAARLAVPAGVAALTSADGVQAVRAGVYRIEIGDVASGNVARGSLTLTGPDATLFDLPTVRKKWEEAHRQN